MNNAESTAHLADPDLPPPTEKDGSHPLRENSSGQTGETGKRGRKGTPGKRREQISTDGDVERPDLPGPDTK